MNPQGTLQGVDGRSSGIGRTVFRLAICVAVVAAITAALLAVHPADRTFAAALTFLFVVLIGSAAWGFRYALVLSFFAAIGFTLIVSPGTFTFDDPRDAAALVAFLVIGITTSRLADRARREALNANQRLAEAVAAQEALRRSEAYLAEAQRLTHTGSWAVDGATRELLYCSAELIRLVGAEPQQGMLTREQIWQRIHPDDRDRVKELSDRTVREKADYAASYRVALPDGTVRHFDAIGHPVLNADGEVVEVLGTNIDVTDRVHAEEVLRRSEAYLAEAQRVSHTGSFGWNVARGDIFWSDETFRIFEIDRTNEVSVETVLWRTHPEDAVRVQEVIARASETGQNFDFEHRLLMPGGSVKHLHVVGHASRDETGGLEFVGAVMDVTEAKRANEKLRQDELELRRLVDAIPHHVVVLEPHGEILYLNQRGLDYAGLTREDVRTPDYLFRAFHPDDLERFRHEREEAVAQGIPWETEARLLGKDGQYRWFLIRINPLRDDEGRIIRWYGTRTDIEDRKRVEAALRGSEAEIRQVLNLVPQFVAVLRAADRNPLYVNQSGLDYLGVTLEEFQSRGKGEFYHPDDRERVAESQSKFLSGSAHEFEARLRRKDGNHRWFLIRFGPWRDEAGSIQRWYVSATDIEDRKQAEDRLARENVSLRQEIDKTSMFEEIVGTSSALREVLSRVSKVAPTDSTVLVTGETGTGKELIARAIHKRSPRSGRAFVSVNCAAIPPALIASELFGHEKGAFTGALQRHLGRFELAEGGTIFLDEVGDLPAETQVALLRVLQERELQRVGGAHPIPVDVRVVAATNRDLQAAIDRGAFRSDLFYRLNVFPIEPPPLRQRREDIPLLVEYFIHRFARKTGKSITSIDKESLDRLQTYPWPGNIRELQNVVERSVIVCDTEVFSVDESWLSRRVAGETQAGSQRLLRAPAHEEKEIIEAALAETRGRVSGPAGAAARLGIPSTTLESKIKALGIDKHQFKAP